MQQRRPASTGFHRLVGIGATLAVLGLAGPVAAAEKTRVIVAFKPGASAAVQRAVAAAGGSVKLEIFGMAAMAIELPTQALQGLQRNPNVEYIEEDVKRYPLAGTSPSNSPYLSGQLEPYGIRMVQADQLPDTYASNRKVCIIDSGYDLTHEDLAANAVTGENDPTGSGNWYQDENHHGTHVAGTISAINNNGTGVVGVAPNRQLKLYIIKVFDAAGYAYSSSLATAANRCGAAGANVISMSLGGSFSSRTEKAAFDSLYANNVLPIAAAGNDGNKRVSYPAGYGSVVSVAAIDQASQWATFSQYNADVELSGPGVNVLSTVPTGTGTRSSLTVGTTVYDPGSMEGSPSITRSGALFDFGIGDAVNAGASGRVCLIARGTIDFSTKVSNCQSSGGVGAVIYNNVAGGFAGTLGTTVTSIPSVTASDTEGTLLRSQLGQSTTVGVAPSNYAFFDGTSMATPHVSAVAALVWSYFPTSCSAAQIRDALNKSAKNLGAAGRDTKFGFGLVQAKAAYDRIALKPATCGN